ncbi:hypothetical protein [Tenacibaculum soleae]|nr:hypothetical protein [Tenacibaculum soleae]
MYSHIEAENPKCKEELIKRTSDSFIERKGYTSEEFAFLDGAIGCFLAHF